MRMAGKDVTVLLRAWGGGDTAAGEELFETIYQELRRMAARQARAREATIHPTALVHEAFIALAAESITDWRDRAQFFAFAAVVMRRLLKDYWRRRQARKRGGDQEWVVFDESVHALIGSGIDVEALDDALTRLAALDATQARIVEYRFYAGLSVDEVAHCLGISPRTVNREWGMAKVWLADQLRTAPSS
ncbi:MAG: sigma-70 family RNA polymerase sigma factor [Acidobacteria bacterium]|nr:sigma-70 family RNA polymerase sigma factor [Acidobacteriota bacterium]